MLRLVALLVVAGVACVAYGIAIERSWYRLRRYDLAILPPGGPQRLAVLHLSDLHFVRTDPKKARFLASLPAADVTVVTGDFLAEPAAVETAVAAVRTVRGSVASWFVLGSNDHFEPKPLNYFAYFRKRRTRRRVSMRVIRRGRAATGTGSCGAGRRRRSSGGGAGGIRGRSTRTASQGPQRYSSESTTFGRSRRRRPSTRRSFAS